MLWTGRANLHKQQILIALLNARLCPMWDYSPWAEGFYVQLRI